jgi:uncharacterized protein with HEPN domain
MKKDPKIFLEHILQNIEKIETFSKNVSKEGLSKDEEKQYAIIRAIEIIGEAVKNLPASFTSKHPDISWREIVGTRDKIIHHYFGIDLKIIWDIIKNNLPDLKKKIERILEEK